MSRSCLRSVSSRLICCRNSSVDDDVAGGVGDLSRQRRLASLFSAFLRSPQYTETRLPATLMRLLSIVGPNAERTSLPTSERDKALSLDSCMMSFIVSARSVIRTWSDSIPHSNSSCRLRNSCCRFLGIKLYNLQTHSFTQRESNSADCTRE